MPSNRDVFLDDLLAQIFEQNDGVFVGEFHAFTATKQIVAECLPLLKSKGVKTISLELPQSMVNEFLKEKTFRDLTAKWPGLMPRWQAEFDLIHAANRLGMKVLGHEKETTEERESRDIFKYAAGTAPKEIQDRENSWAAKATSEEGVRERDQYAAQYIKHHRIGKAVIIGGTYHSGNYNSDDAYVNPVSRFLGVLPRGGNVGKSYQGLDKLLGYPSIDTVLTGHQPGQVVRTDGRFNDYEVCLPGYLGRLNTPILPFEKPNPLRGVRGMSQKD